VSAYGRGDDPDVRDYLKAAGASREQLGLLIDNFLAYAPIGPTDEETIVLINSRVSGRPALEEARVRRRLDLSSIGAQLREKLSLSVDLSDRVTAAYGDLERDWLDPRGVHPTVWEALRSIFDFDVRRLVGQAESDTPAVVLRRSVPADAVEHAVSAMTEHQEAHDEVDRLFRGPVDH
jgi:hypothetical protein